jgi:hypothetical protein
LLGQPTLLIAGRVPGCQSSWRVLPLASERARTDARNGVSTAGGWTNEAHGPD